jgi:transmembrane sensor
MLESRIWTLITKKLSGDASEEGLVEIDELLKDNREIFLQGDMLLADWEQKSMLDESTSDTAFGRMVEKIKEMQQTEKRVRKSKELV